MAATKSANPRRRRGLIARFPATIEVNFTSKTAMNRFIAKATFNTGITTRTDDNTLVQVQL